MDVVYADLESLLLRLTSILGIPIKAKVRKSEVVMTAADDYDSHGRAVTLLDAKVGVPPVRDLISLAFVDEVLVGCYLKTCNETTTTRLVWLVDESNWMPCIDFAKTTSSVVEMKKWLDRTVEVKFRWLHSEGRWGRVT